MGTFIFFWLGLALLYFGGEGLVRGASAVGMRMRLSPVVIGLTLVAFATSAPELAISASAALRNLPGLAVGNVVGSNICNLALIFGLVAVVKPASIRDALSRRDVLVMAITTLLVPGLLLDGSIGRLEGSLLVLSITAYVALTVLHTRSTKGEPTEELAVPVLTESIVLNLLLCAGSLAMLIYGSQLFIIAAVAIAKLLNVPTAIVGLSAAALGSSLPELTASIISARHGHPEMAAGNLIGSNIFNLLLILGVTSTIRPLSSSSVTLVDFGTMILVTGVAIAIMLTRKTVGRPEGYLLLGIYLVYMAWLFLQ